MSNNFKKGVWIPTKTFSILILLALITFTFVTFFVYRGNISKSNENNISQIKDEKNILLDIEISESEKKAIDVWLGLKKLNEYGDAQGTAYLVNPLFDASTGETINRYTYLVNKFPNRPWQYLKK